MFFRKNPEGIFIEVFKIKLELFKASVIDSFRKAATANASFWSDMLFGKNILFEVLNQVPGRFMFL